MRTLENHRKGGDLSPRIRCRQIRNPQSEIRNFRPPQSV
jgi:hypothetical protein